ncbi:hypothetical protein QCA50_002550 [Cerrena zonata]|uniref:F-box domain-containing protein n=1 Tax=Cerrena zonata TaxID=2478898 RepID=A0AAW0GX32_9APHY
MVYNTRKRTRATTDAAGATSATDSDVENALTPSPVKRVKRVKQSKAVENPKPTVTRIRRKGTLQELPKMPLDIIDEVLVHLHLGDLLNLSRTTKAFRELVLAPGAERFWNAAMENAQAAGVPACPEWLSKPAYANLIYSPHCHNCLAGNVQAIFFVWGVRYCKKCQEELLLEDKPANFSSIRSAHGFCSTAEIRSQKSTKRKWRSFPQVIKTKYFLKSDVQEILDRLHRGEFTDRDWHKAREISVLKREKWAEQCRKWHESQLEAREKELQGAKNQRLASIISNLKELGWEEELTHMDLELSHPLLKLKQIRQPRALTERAWEAMKEEVVSFMNQKKVERLTSEYQELLGVRTRALSTFWWQLKGELTHRISQERDAASFPSIKALMDSPPGTEITSKSFEPLKRTIVEEMAEFQQRQKVIIREWIEDETGLQLSTDVDLFDLAVTSQARDQCHRLLEHYYFDSQDLSDEQHEELVLDYFAEDRYDTFMDKVTGARRWSTSPFCIPWLAVKYVIEAAGEDPASVTAVKMDKTDIRWYCAGPCHSVNARMIMNWRAAVLHASQDHANTNIKRVLSIAKPEEAKQIAPLELAELKRNRDRHDASSNTIFWCQQCPVRFPHHGERAVKHHLQTWHGISKVEVSDFQRDRGQHYPVEPFFILVKPSTGPRTGEAYKLANASLKRAENSRTVIGKLSTYK